MRTTLTMDDDVAAAVQKLRQERSLGMSEAVNHLVRAGLAKSRQRKVYRHWTMDMGPARVDIANIGEVLDLLDEM